MTKLSIAGLPIEVESADKEYFAERFADYMREDDRPPVMRMRTMLLNPVPRPEGEVLKQIKESTIMRMADGRNCYYITDKKGKLGYATYYSSDYSDVEIQLLATRKHPIFSQRDWEYMHTGFFFANRMATLGGGVLHSSSLAYKGQGICFTANSGTGKSTHVGLWKQRFGDDVDIINDDKPAIYFDGDTPILCGNPWSGKTALNMNKQVPLKAIVVVERGEKNSIRLLDTIERMYHLANQIVRPFYDDELSLKILDFTEKLLHSVPVYCLTCNVSQEAVDTVFNEIF